MSLHDTTNEIPYGYCHCGCGQKTLLADRTDINHGYIKGEPRRFLLGHNKHTRNVAIEPNPSGLCMCGCGQAAPLARDTNAKQYKLKGKPMRYIDGHSHGWIKAVKAITKHGQSSSDDHKLWCKIKKRCFNAAASNYRDYGGRGIIMHPDWQHDFLKFQEYIHGLDNYGQHGLTLDRIDNNGNYEPGNLRWADRLTQSNNTRRSRFLEFNGEIHTVSEWARIIKIPVDALSARLKMGWTIERALTAPLIFKPSRRIRSAEDQ